MTTVLMYLVIAAVIGAILFVAAMLVFGRGEQLPPLPARTSPAQLPARGIDGDDVRAVKFSLAVRGYRMSDVDWTLERLAEELDRYRARIAELEGTDPGTGAGAEAEEADLPFAAADLAAAPVGACPQYRTPDPAAPSLTKPAGHTQDSAEPPYRAAPEQTPPTP